jgi:hypothetical protein
MLLAMRNAMMCGGNPKPVVSSLSTPYGDTTGGDAVAITGKHFTGATSIEVGGTACPSYTVLSDTSIACVVPAKAAGTYDVVVKRPGGSGKLAASYTARTNLCSHPSRLDLWANTLGVSARSATGFTDDGSNGSHEIYEAQGGSTGIATHLRLTVPSGGCRYSRVGTNNGNSNVYLDTQLGTISFPGGVTNQTYVNGVLDFDYTPAGLFLTFFTCNPNGVSSYQGATSLTAKFTNVRVWQ